jgi:hypothetical protein
MSAQSFRSSSPRGGNTFSKQQTNEGAKKMQEQEQTTQTTDIPKWSALLVEAVNKPGLIMKAYSAFWPYSVGNQILALIQCQLRGIEPGPINTFPKWQTLGRVVKRGEKALTLCMPITRKRRADEQSTDSPTGDEAQTYTAFVHKARWFVVSQTFGNELGPITIPEWDAEQALKTLCIARITFDKTDGNCQGFARLCCRQHKRAYVAKSVMWRLAFILSFHGQTSQPNAT